MAEINKKTLGHLAELARVELNAKEEEKLLNDLGKILAHFEELQELNTDNVQPMTGPRSAGGFGEASGTELKNVLREDGETTGSLAPDKVVEQFPEKEKHWLKIPPVFE